MVLGTFDELSRDGIYVKNLNLQKYSEIPNGKLDTVTKVRYNDLGNPAIIEQVGDIIKVYFGNGVNSIAPGQAAVFYEGDDMIGGGWIAKNFKQSSLLNDTISNV